jgi:hypothetical protein
MNISKKQKNLNDKLNIIVANLLSKYNPKNIKENYRIEYVKDNFIKINEETKEEIILKYSTIYNKIGEVLSIFKYITPLTEEQTKEQEDLRLALKHLKDKIDNIPKEEYDTNLRLENLKEIWEKYDKNNKYKLIVGLYLFIPALRTDYINAKIDKTNFIISNYVKVNTDLGTTIKIPTELKEYINEFDNLPKNSNAFKALLRTASKNIYNQEYSIDIYRRCWTEFSLRTMNTAEIKKIAKAMNHSYEVHCLVYSPKLFT